MTHFQIPELRAKLKHALALAADPSTTVHERAAARRAAERIRAKLKAREGVEGSAPFPQTPRAEPNFFFYENVNGKVRTASANTMREFQEAMRKMNSRRENPAYPKAYR